MRIRIACLASLAALAFAAPGVMAQENQVGRDAFQTSCAVCHGTTATGDGEFADVLAVKPPDLTILASKNHGVFPYLDVLHIIDGRTSIRSHGPTIMPIWGNVFKAKVGDSAGPMGSELVVRATMVSLVDYLESLQK